MFNQLTKQATTPSTPPTNFITSTQAFFAEVVADPVHHLLIPLGYFVLVIVATMVILRILDRLIDQIFTLSRMDTRRAHTLRKLIKSVAHYGIYFVALLTILINMGFNPMPVLAGAGVLGLAIGFGAQNLVRDVITGFFLIFEGQLEVGDSVQINGQTTGTVEEVGLRVTKIREFNQRLHYLSNGTITQVTNYNREKMRAIVPITVPYDADLDVVREALGEVCATIEEKYTESLVNPPEVIGITQMDPIGVQFTITALSEPTVYAKIEREMRQETINALHSKGIHIASTSNIAYTPGQVKK